MKASKSPLRNKKVVPTGLAPLDARVKMKLPVNCWYVYYHYGDGELFYIGMGAEIVRYFPTVKATP